MEYSITADNIHLLCRICLTSSRNLACLSESFGEDKDNQTIQCMLETVSCNKIIVDCKKFPSKICKMCLSLLKLSYDFQAQFKESQQILKNITKDFPVEEPRALLKGGAPVELIYGSSKYDLNDVVVVEDISPEKPTFEGFLRNLGTEVSARFVRGAGRKPPCTPPEPSVVLRPLNTERGSQSISNSAPGRVPLDTSNVVRMPEASELGSSTKTKARFQCRLCDKLFRTRHNLRNHIKVYHIKPCQFICEQCGHVAHSSSSLYHHLQNHKGKRFKCDECDKCYVSGSRLKEHRKIHSNERPYLCNVCGKNFNYSVALKYHQRLHTDEKKYVCSYCGLKYRMDNTLKRHLRTHTRDKPYQCGYCLKKFSSQGERHCHEMRHTGVKPHVCEYCQKSFTTSWALQTHCLSHSGAFECHCCTKTFIDAKFLSVHMKRVHK